MDLAILTTSYIAPFLPYLLKIGKPIAENAGQKLGEKVGEGSWEKAKQIWKAIASQINTKPLAKGATEALAQDIENKEAYDVLAQQIQKLINENPELLHTLHPLLEDELETPVEEANISQIVLGDKNIVIGNAKGAINISQN